MPPTWRRFYGHRHPCIMDPPRWLLGLLFRPFRMLIVCVLLAVLSFRVIMHVERHNPNSHFFDPTPETFEGRYSSARKAQARAWIDLQDSSLQSDAKARVPLYAPLHDHHAPTDLSVVFVAVRRPQEQYLDISFGSFMLELSAEQRRRIHVTVSLGEDDPFNQPFFTTAWLHGLADEVAVRTAPSTDYLPASLKAHKSQPTAKLTVIALPEYTLANKDIQTKEWHQRSTLDYSVALELCQKQATPYCMIVEDDVVFATRWFDALTPLLRKADERQHSPNARSWAYMRLFYAEKYFGWETEEVQKLVLGCVSVVSIVVLVLLLFGRFPARFAALAGVRSRSDLLYSHRPGIDADERKSSLLRSSGNGNRVARIRLPLGTQLIIILMTIYYCVLAILAGRNHIYQIPTGVSELNERGCCTQAIIYPSEVIAPIKDHLRDRVGVRPYDILINRWVAQNERSKLVIQPPLVQHIGLGSTQAMVDETYYRSTPLWSFAFEQLTSKLKQQHDDKR